MIARKIELVWFLLNSGKEEWHSRFKDFQRLMKNAKKTDAIPKEKNDSRRHQISLQATT